MGIGIIQITNIKLCTWVIPLMMLGCLPCIADQSDAITDNEQSSVSTASQVQKTGNQDKKNRRSRLKYRSGPVCMCNDGMSEAEIQAAMEKHRSEQ